MSAAAASSTCSATSTLRGRSLFGLKLVQAALLCTLALTVQTLVNHKYTGYFVMVLYFLASSFAARFNFEHHLYRYATAPSHVYSDMNGFGPFLRPIVWFDAYWAAAACLLAGVSCLLWVRGHETGPRARLQLAAARLTRPVRLWLGGSALVLVVLGAFLYYNTNVLNRYRTDYDRREESAAYERRYRRLKDVAQPRVTAIRLECDLVPERRSLRARGVFDLRNKTGQPITTVYVDLSDELKLRRLALGGLPRPTEADEKLGFYTFTLPAPLLPGADATLSFEVDYAPRGITNQTAGTFVAENGTFFNSALFPRIGYQEDRELEDDSERRRHGLSPRERMPDVADLAARRNNLISNDADWIDLDLTISTVPDQIALAPGALVRSWDAGGRRYFQYRSERPVLRFFSVLSARYQVLRDRWRDVAIEIYYHPGHEYNLKRMVESVKASLEYFTTHFSPFQYRQVRIIEFPRYATFAQSFPGSIPYSENIGFIAKVDPQDPDDVDYPFYVTAHEVAHQWWAHQMIGGRVQGVTFLDETLAQYSALMVMKRSFGDTQMRRFLRYELDRYLSGRGRERKKELPLYRVEDQPYVHYSKGSLVMYALQDYLGEDVINRCLAAYIQKTAYQEPPYTNSIELIALLRAATPPAERYLITDLFETITLHDLRATTAKYRKVGDKYEVTLTVSASKFRADEFGKETSIPVDERVDIGVQDGEGKFLYLAKHPLRGATASYTVAVERPPAKAGVDPLNKLIDRKPDDNVIAVSATEP
jgi:ABC-2 type transport system permease protein